MGKVERTELFEALTSAEVTEPDRKSEREHIARALDAAQESAETGQTERPGTWVYRVISFVGGSKVATLVETQGLEPWTPCLQSRCSSQLSYVPKDNLCLKQT